MIGFHEGKHKKDLESKILQNDGLQNYLAKLRN